VGKSLAAALLLPAKRIDLQVMMRAGAHACVCRLCSPAAPPQPACAWKLHVSCFALSWLDMVGVPPRRLCLARPLRRPAAPRCSLGWAQLSSGCTRSTRQLCSSWPSSMAGCWNLCEREATTCNDSDSGTFCTGRHASPPSGVPCTVVMLLFACLLCHVGRGDIFRTGGCWCLPWWCALLLFVVLHVGRGICAHCMLRATVSAAAR